MVLVIAHRTCPRDAPENSVAGIRKAAAQGADLVEVDVRRTRDGVPVLLHDPLLLRTAGVPLPVSWLGARTVASLRLQWSGERVPRLDDALAALDAGLGMALDVKDGGAMDATIRSIREADALDRVLLWSQHAAAVRDALGLAPGVEVALLRDTTTPAQTHEYVRDAQALGAHAVSLHQDAVSTDAVAEAHAAGLRVYSWGQTERRTKTLVAAGIDGVVTDWPASARQEITG